VEETEKGRVEKIVAQGKGLVRTPKGIFFCEPGSVLPGEVIEYEYPDQSAGQTRSQKHLKIVRILTSSPDRVVPQCIVYSECGGCDLMHGNEKIQKKVKTSILLDSLERLGKIRGEQLPTVQFWRGKSWGYRNRIQVQVQNRVAGYFSRSSKTHVPTRECKVASDVLQKVFQYPFHEDGKYQALGPGSGQEYSLVQLHENRPGFRAFTRVEGLPEGIPMKVEDTFIQVHAGQFFQSNREGLEELIKEIREGIERVFPNRSGLRVLELYCGSGILGSFLPHHVSQIQGVDSDQSLPGEYGPRGNKKVQRVEEFLRQSQKSKGFENWDFLLADPSRKGLAKEFFSYVTSSHFPPLFLLFCDPASAGRDLGYLVSLGYSIETLSLLDFYPQTSEFEVFSILIHS